MTFEDENVTKNGNKYPSNPWAKLQDATGEGLMQNITKDDREKREKMREKS